MNRAVLTVLIVVVSALGVVRAVGFSDAGKPVPLEEPTRPIGG